MNLPVSLIEVPGGKIAASTFGEGPPVIFLHGGPGDTHDYMKRMAEPMFDKFQCIFFDQRGAGGSSHFIRDESEFKVDSLLKDLLAVAAHFRVVRPSLVGHSWGAMYALFACIKFSGLFSKAALVSMGPLDVHTTQTTNENLLSALSDREKAEWSQLRLQRNSARDKGDIESVTEIDKALMQLRVNAWIFNPDLRASFLAEYHLDPPPDREVNKWVWSDAETWFSWDSLKNVCAELWICAGVDDSVPISQAEKVTCLVAKSESLFINECGHIPWLEKPDVFYPALQNFLGR